MNAPASFDTDLVPLYADHLATMKRRADEALARGGFDYLVVPSGTQHWQVFDDRDYPYAVNPQFKAWLPLTRLPYSWLVYTPGQVQPKYLINADNFKPGYVTPNDAWENRLWKREAAQDTEALRVIGFAPNLPHSGNGAKSLGQELAASNAFAQCQVEKVFRAICFRSPTSQPDIDLVRGSTGTFKNGGNGNLKQVFADVAAYCAGSN